MNWLPWLTTIGGASVMWLAGKPKTRRAAWIVGILNQAPWIAYAILAGAWGFIPGSILYSAVYIRNLSQDHN